MNGAGEQVEVKLRALMGDFDGRPVFLGAMERVGWEALTVSEYVEWADNLRAEFGIPDAIEVDITLSVPADLFATPQLSAEVNPDA